VTLALFAHPFSSYCQKVLIALWADGTPPGAMKMVDHKVSPGGNIIATYEPSGEVKLGTFASPSPSEREQERQEQMKLEDAEA